MTTADHRDEKAAAAPPPVDDGMAAPAVRERINASLTGIATVAIPLGHAEGRELSLTDELLEHESGTDRRNLGSLMSRFSGELLDRPGSR